MTDTKPAQHTPTPWAASNAPDGSGIPGWNIRAANAYPICSMMDCNTYTREVNPHNAAFIVQACNSHDALVAACETALSAVAGVVEDGAPLPKNLRDVLRAALAQARGGA